MNSLQRVFSTDPTNASALLIRVTLGAVMFMHGAQKLFGWFGGQGFTATMQTFTEQMHLPAVLAFLVIFFETIGAICLILGLGSRVMAFGIMSIMIGALILVHWNYGFFMNWHGLKAGEGFEYHLLAIASSLGIVLQGGGQWSIDSLLKFDTKQEANAHSQKEIVGA
jgi:putative oxidoreductase